MILSSLFVGGAIVAEAWLLALVALRGRRPWLQATFAAFALTLILNGAAYIGTTEGFLPSAWELGVLGSFVLAHALLAVLVLSLLHGETVPRRRPWVLLLLAVPVATLFVPSASEALGDAYAGPNLLSALLIVCLGIALAEPLYTRLTSALLSADAFWLASGVVAFILGGPVYTYELDALGLAVPPGTNLLAPIALGLFAVVLFHADPFKGPRLPPAKRSESAGVAGGGTLVFDEARPRYLVTTAVREARAGRPVLALVRTTDVPTAEDVTVVGITPGRHAALRALASASEFLTRRPGGLVALPDVADLAALSGWPSTREALIRLRQVCEDTRSTLILAPWRLTRKEREGLPRLRVQLWPLPEPVREVEAILAGSFGTGGRRLMEAYARSRGLGREDLRADDLEDLAGFLERAVADLAGPLGDAPAADILRGQARHALARVDAFLRRTAEDLASGAWPSSSSGPSDDLLVTAAEYWKGREMDELVARAEDIARRESVGELARRVFVEQLGAAGDGLFRAELAKLGKAPGDLRPEDVGHLADRAAVDLAAMAEVVDVAQEKTRLERRVESIRKSLQAIAEDPS